ncbi:hypothetical protein B0T20DRAFT_434669 [Sordaria brevicollis]|uniref:Uncharacterized protein n=1 Tax=Sordaria brevicollis TaxID=83679 RepID=A0AAE0PHA9_SORBR|nr:hypothetical protein B0T20DRAFT_434669 [Sordaria brevicollis]
MERLDNMSTPVDSNSEINNDENMKSETEVSSGNQGQGFVYQELSARITNPVKLAALLRAQFGDGQYEVSMIRSVYNVGTPRRLSLTEISLCRGL